MQSNSPSDNTAVVIATIHGKVGLCTLNRPKRLNAWTDNMQTQLYNALEEFERDPRVSVIVVTGAGRGFCAGADLGNLDTLASSTGPAVVPPPHTDSRSFLLPMYIHKPIIAAVNGPVAGMGFGFALCCDMRFSNRKAKWCGAFSKRGLVAEWGTSFLLPRLIGTGNAMMMMMDSEVVLGEEAMRLGLVQKVFDGDCLAKTLLYAQQLANNVSPVSLAGIKRQIWTHPALDDDEALRQTVALMRASLSTGNADFKEGVKSFLEKRKPRFGSLDRKNPVLKTMQILMQGMPAKL